MMISLIRDLGEIGSVLEKADGGLVMSCGVRHLKECPAVGVFGHTLSIEVYEIYPTLLFWNVDNVNILRKFSTHQDYSCSIMVKARCFSAYIKKSIHTYYKSNFHDF